MTEERRSPVEHRAANLDNVDFKERVITVIAVPYEDPTPVEYRGQVWQEVFSRSAFNGIETRQRRIPVTAVLQAPSVEHNNGHIVGKVSNFYPERSDGLVLDVRISKTTHGDEMLQLAADDALSPSIGFAHRPSDQQLDKRTMTRRVNRAFLDHLAFVGQPAYPNAQVLSVREAQPFTDAGLPMLNTPALDGFLEDPVFQWAADRARRQQTS